MSPFPFSLRLESGYRSINFPNLSVILVERHDIVPQFNIFRKSSHTGGTFNGASFHPHAQMRAAYLAMINGLISILQEESMFEREFNTIKHIANKNSVIIDIDKIVCCKFLHATATFSLISTLSFPEPSLRKKTWVKLPFLGNISYRVPVN